MLARVALGGRHRDLRLWEDRTMSIVPRGEAEMLQFFESRAAMWSADPLALCLTLDQSTALTASGGQASAKFDAAYNAAIAARSATIEKTDALAELRTLAGSSSRSFGRLPFRPMIRVCTPSPASRRPRRPSRL